MPYIRKELRAFLEPIGDRPQTPGELNFVFTRWADDYIERKGLSYTTLNEVIGALECAKQELYLRVAGPLEADKRHENGDVYRSITKSL